jgi:hypothetical protein
MGLGEIIYMLFICRFFERTFASFLVLIRSNLMDILEILANYFDLLYQNMYKNNLSLDEEQKPNLSKQITGLCRKILSLFLMAALLINCMFGLGL